MKERTDFIMKPRQETIQGETVHVCPNCKQPVNIYDHGKEVFDKKGGKK